MSLSQTLSALSEPNRQKIIELLKKRDLPVAEMGKRLDVSGATLSHHLDILKRANLVSSRREGQQIFYSLNLSVVEEVTEKIIKFLNVKK